MSVPTVKVNPDFPLKPRSELAAVVVWNAGDRLPLLRVDPSVVSPPDYPRVEAWAARELAAGLSVSWLLATELDTVE